MGKNNHRLPFLFPGVSPPACVRAQPQSWASLHTKTESDTSKGRGEGCQTPTSFTCPTLCSCDILEVSRYDLGRKKIQNSVKELVWVPQMTHFLLLETPRKELQNDSPRSAPSVGQTQSKSAAPLRRRKLPGKAKCSTLEKTREGKRARGGREGGGQSQEKRLLLPSQYKTQKQADTRFQRAPPELRSTKC